MSATEWLVERVTGTTREPVAHGTVPTCQYQDDTAIAVATKVGQVIKRDLSTVERLAWIDIASKTARRHELTHDVSGEWEEMRYAIRAALEDGVTTALIHRGEKLHIRFSDH
ncbi:hypothetical protein [Nocardia sp. NPDC057030]|uniref:hypothetical protein n=1 Tax=unclassified Nocardia TaxID=2637762 RepID=UPI00364598CF